MLLLLMAVLRLQRRLLHCVVKQALLLVLAVVWLL